MDDGERDPRYQPELRERAAKLYKEGLTTSEVAAAMKLSRVRVGQLLDEAGVERRPRGRPPKSEAA